MSFLLLGVGSTVASGVSVRFNGGVLEFLNDDDGQWYKFGLNLTDGQPTGYLTLAGPGSPSALSGGKLMTTNDDDLSDYEWICDSDDDIIYFLNWDSTPGSGSDCAIGSGDLLIESMSDASTQRVGCNNASGVPVLYTVTQSSGSLFVTAGRHAHWDAASESYANNDPVTQWSDISGNDRHLVQGTTAPVFKTGIVNGNPVVDFPSVNGYGLQNASFGGSGLSASEIYAVLVGDNDGLGFSGNAIWNFHNHGSEDYYCDQDSGAKMGFGSTARKSTGSPSISIESYHLLNISSEAGSWIMRINGAVHFSTATNTFGMRDSVILGKTGVSSLCKFAEIIIYDSVLSAGDRTKNENYLKAKYGLVF